MLYRAELEQIKAITQAKLDLLKLKEKVSKRPKGAWSYKDSKFIVDNWGKLSAMRIAEKLNKTYDAIINRANNLSLKSAVLYSEQISICELLTILNKTNNNYTWFMYLLERENAPIIDKCFYKNKSIRCIKLQDFYDWFETHQNLLDIHGYAGELENEPQWFLEKVEIDKLNHVYKSKRQWTEQEKDTIDEMIKQGYGYRDISIKLKRTGGALKRYFLDNHIAKPIKADNHTKWTQEEIKKVKELYLRGCCSSVIQEHINRSDLAINSILERNKYFGFTPLRFKYVAN